MNIQATSFAVPKQLKSPNPATKPEVPEWVDGFVPNPHTKVKSAVAVTAGTGLGVALGSLVDQMLLGGAVGLGAGLAASLGLHLHARHQRKQTEQSVLRRHAEQRANLQKDLGVPEQPSAVFERAKVYESARNLLVEFPASGGFLSVTNTGPKRSVLWVPESQAYGSAGEALGRINEGIERTEMKVSQPLGRASSHYGGHDIKHRDPLGAADLQVQLDREGRLNLAHSGSPDEGVTYDLQTGKVSSPFLTIDHGEITKFSPAPSYVPTAYRYVGEGA